MGMRRILLEDERLALEYRAAPGVQSLSQNIFQVQYNPFLPLSDKQHRRLSRLGDSNTTMTDSGCLPRSYILSASLFSASTRSFGRFSTTSAVKKIVRENTAGSLSWDAEWVPCILFSDSPPCSGGKCERSGSKTSVLVFYWQHGSSKFCSTPIVFVINRIKIMTPWPRAWCNLSFKN